MAVVAIDKAELRRWAGRIVLVGGACLMLVFFAPRVPRDQSLVFRVGRDVRRIDASFTREGETEPRRGVTLEFQGSAPPSVTRSVSLPNGSYVVAVEIQRQAAEGEPSETRYSRRVTLEGGETVLALEPAP
jgi:hypothetical protein